MRLLSVSLAFVMLILFAASGVEARNAEQFQAGGNCRLTCKQPYKTCFRSVCRGVPNYKGGTTEKRALIEKFAREQCQSEFAKAKECVHHCGKHASLPLSMASLMKSDEAAPVCTN